MITVDFSKRGKLSLCDYIIEVIKKNILDGTLVADEKLPSKRSLAEHLGVSVITVQNAYNQLISEGYLYSLEKKGYFVTDIEIENAIMPFAKNQKSKIKKSIAKKVEKSVTVKADFTSNSTSVEKFPFALWAHIMRQVLNSEDEKLLRRVDVYGAIELRLSIAKYLKQFRNIDVRHEQIVIGAGTENLYSMIVQLLGRDKIYAVENPGYHKVAKTFLSNDAKCVPINIDEQGINIDELIKSNADVAHVSPSHHFPTGIVMPVRRRLELLNWVNDKTRNRNRYIIEDDYDSEFRFDGKPLQSLQSYNSANNVIYVNTFSKTLSPSFRISYMVLPNSLIDVFNKKLGFYSCSVSAFEQYTLARFIDEGFYEKHIIKMKNYYRQLRNQLIIAFEKSKLSKISEIKEENSGLHFLLTVKSKKSETQIQKLLSENKIKIAMLSDFYYDNKSVSHVKNQFTFVVNYSALKKEKISEAVRLLEKCFL